MAAQKQYITAVQNEKQTQMQVKKLKEKQ